MELVFWSFRACDSVSSTYGIRCGVVIDADIRRGRGLFARFVSALANKRNDVTVAS